jgi:hypothetical protein
MKLTLVTPGSPGFEIRSLECPECEHAIAQRIAVDPITGSSRTRN